ncbi:hypothetical protein [Bartonella sp. CB74]
MIDSINFGRNCMVKIRHLLGAHIVEIGSDKVFQNLHLRASHDAD